jgi:hypothetical protein
MRTTSFEKWLEPLGAEIIAAVETCMLDGKVKMTQNYRTTINLDMYVMDFCVYPAFVNDDAVSKGPASKSKMHKIKALMRDNEAKSENHSVLVAISNLFRVYNRVTTIGLSNPFNCVNHDLALKATLKDKSLGSNVSVAYIYNPPFKHYDTLDMSQGPLQIDDFRSGAYDAFQKFYKVVLVSAIE